MKIIPFVGNGTIAPLYELYAGQTQPQSAFVAIDGRTGEVWAATNAEIGNVVPMDVWEGYVRRFKCPNTLHKNYIMPYIQEVVGLIDEYGGLDANVTHVRTWGIENFELDEDLEDLYTTSANDESINVKVYP